MDQEASLILNDIDETRHSLSQKLNVLEDQVKETVQSARQKVESTMESFEVAKSKVQDAVERMKESLDVRRQVERHPWTMVGASLGAGFLAGSWVGNRRVWPPKLQTQPSSETLNETDRYYPLSPPAQMGYPRSHVRRSLGNWFSDTFRDEIRMAKGMLVEAALERGRQFAHQRFPQISHNIDRIIDSAQDKFTK